VLDNCEHLVDAVAVLADALLRSCPQLRIMATSGAAGHWWAAGLQRMAVPARPAIAAARPPCPRSELVALPTSTSVTVITLGVALTGLGNGMLPLTALTWAVNRITIAQRGPWHRPGDRHAVHRTFHFHAAHRRARIRVRRPAARSAPPWQRSSSWRCAATTSRSRSPTADRRFRPELTVRTRQTYPANASSVSGYVVLPCRQQAGPTKLELHAVTTGRTRSDCHVPASASVPASGTLSWRMGEDRRLPPGAGVVSALQWDRAVR
jgi:hypothetical protein